MVFGLTFHTCGVISNLTLNIQVMICLPIDIEVMKT